VLGHATSLHERTAQQELDLGVDASQLVIGPAGQRVMDCRVEPEQHLSALAHVYSEPAFTIGDGG
jgi:hypothetical protein